MHPFPITEIAWLTCESKVGIFSLQQKNISTSVEILEAERDQVALESEHMLSEVGNPEHQALTKGQRNEDL
jgi:hypothetical protein